MNYVILFGSMFVFVAFISWRWVKLIDYMKEKHPDYKGEDFLNWDRKNDNWDDDKVHTEDKI